MSLSKIFLPVFLVSVFLGKSLNASTPLVIYCRDSFRESLGKMIKEQFTQDVRVVFLSGHGLLTRLRLERNKSPADIIMGLDTTQISELWEQGMAADDGIVRPAPMIPVTWPKTPLIPLAWEVLSILSHGDVTSIGNLYDLLKDNRQLIIPDPRTSTTGLEFLYQVRFILGNDASTFWKRLRKKTLAWPAGLGASFALFMAKPGTLTIAYSTSAQRIGREDIHTISNNLPGVVQVYGFVVTPKGKHHHLTPKIAGFLCSDAAQKKIHAMNLIPAWLDTGKKSSFKNVLPPPFLTPDEKRKLITEWLAANRD